MRMTSEEPGMSAGSDKWYVTRSQISTSVSCLFCNNYLIPEPASRHFSEREMCKQHMDIYLWFYFCNNICNGKGKENPKKRTQCYCEATGIDRLALSHKLDVKSHLEDTLNVFWHARERRWKLLAAVIEIISQTLYWDVHEWLKNRKIWKQDIWCLPPIVRSGTALCSSSML